MFRGSLLLVNCLIRLLPSNSVLIHLIECICFNHEVGKLHSYHVHVGSILVKVGYLDTEWALA